MRLRVADAWAEDLSRFPDERVDVYLSEAYVRLDAERQGATPECVIVEEGEHIWMLPYLRRPVPLLDGDKWDIETAYGYGGPVCTTDDLAFAGAAFDTFAADASGRGCVAAFLRFHPVLGTERYVSQACRVLDDRATVAVDLTKSEEELLSDMHPKHRNMVRRAERQDWAFETSDSVASFMEFGGVYDTRMRELGADEYYLFQESYFEALSEHMGSGAFVASVRAEDAMLAGSVALSRSPYGHYHLAAGVREGAQGAANYLVWRLMLEFKEQGFGMLHLGGGATRAADDSLLKFKSRFGGECLTFRIGQAILDAGGYAEACERWRAAFPDKGQHYEHLFLKYRF